MAMQAEGSGSALAGVTVVDFTQLAAGPWCTSLLGDMGANVIKVERPDGGDLSRSIDSIFGVGNGSTFVSLNRNKRSIALDLENPEHRELARRIVEKADVVIENLKLGALESLGLSYDELSRINPGLIWCSIKGYGELGPEADRPAVDTVIQGRAGLIAHTGSPEYGPVRVAVAMADFTAACLALYGVTMALYERTKSGLGQRVSVSLLGGVIMHFANFAASHAITGEPRGLSGWGGTRSQPSGIFSAMDRPLVISAPSQRMWRALVKTLDRMELLKDARFSDNELRVANREALKAAMEDSLMARNANDWVLALNDAGVPSSTLADFGSLMNDPQVMANGILSRVPFPPVGDVTVVSHPVKFSRTPGTIRSGPPGFGAHHEEVLREFGLLT